MKKRKQKNRQEADDQRTQMQADAYARNRDSYNRAYSACLEGRGYTVK